MRSVSGYANALLYQLHVRDDHALAVERLREREGGVATDVRAAEGDGVVDVAA